LGTGWPAANRPSGISTAIKEREKMANIYDYTVPTARPAPITKDNPGGIRLVDLIGIDDGELQRILDLLAPDCKPAARE
jgi:hypothetical protein